MTRYEAERRVLLGECPPGLFRFEDCLGFKSEYRTESQSYPGFWQSDAYVVESGEYFWGGVSDARERERLLVTPIDPADALPADDGWRPKAGYEALRFLIARTEAVANYLTIHRDDECRVQWTIDDLRAAAAKGRAALTSPQMVLGTPGEAQNTESSPKTTTTDDGGRG